MPEFINKIAYCKFIFPKGKEVNFNVDIPIVLENVLDETLNSCAITLSHLRKSAYPEVDVRKPFEPFTKVKIGFLDKYGNAQRTVIQMVVAHDDLKMQRKSLFWKSWTHSVRLVEETKKLERESVDVLTFTNPLERHYDAEAEASWDEG